MTQIARLVCVGKKQTLELGSGEPQRLALHYHLEGQASIELPLDLTSQKTPEPLHLATLEAKPVMVDLCHIQPTNNQMYFLLLKSLVRLFPKQYGLV